MAGFYWDILTNFRSGRTHRRTEVALVLLALCCVSGCGVGFVWQSAMGQLELSRSARPIAEVVQDPATLADTRALLQEVASIKRYAALQGLSVSANYEDYVPLTDSRDPNYVVWFVNASERLSFVPKLFAFPIVGSFPGLAWFDERDAERFAAGLRKEGWDVNIRGVSAYSTGGWFSDPLLWTMLSDGENAYGALVNVILHESVHASILVRGQQYFNESLASFVANGMTPQYLAQRFGTDSSRLLVYLERRQLFLAQMKHLVDAYSTLEQVYAGDQSDSLKLEAKQRVFKELAEQLQTEQTLNNATLVGVQLYRVAGDEFGLLLETCGYSWPHFLRATGSLAPEHFELEQQADFGSVVMQLVARGCRPLPPIERPRVFLSKPERERRNRARRYGSAPAEYAIP